MPEPVHPELTERLRRGLGGARAQRQTLPLVPELALYLINPDFPDTPLTGDEMREVMERPCYWSLCWASGQVLARWLLDHPDTVRGKRVLDFGAGSGVAAIAAAKAGAAHVIACDLDPDALLACQHNATLNAVHLELLADIEALAESVDLILVADVLYDHDNLPWLDRLLACADEVLLAESRLPAFSHPGFRLMETRQASTVPDLDHFDDFKQVRLYCGRQNGSIELKK
ncbi:MAG TPA: 50S ribosomal protein L11 methyltransferase [Spongiibacteraceae bacterium]|nr:50S ribosomal protein L11 methyltransferase [Spongiibacteraceae bacterium]